MPLLVRRPKVARCKDPEAAGKGTADPDETEKNTRKGIHMTDSNTVSRRSFLKGSGVALAGAALVGLAGCGNGGSASPGADGEWDYETDVVVVGFGIAGTTAACEASDAGAEVILLEKAPKEEAGGSSRVNGGFLTIDEDYDDAESCYRYWRGMYDKDVIEARLDAWPLMEEWLDANPIDCLEEYSDRGDVTLAQYFHPSGGYKIYPGLEAAVASRPIQVLYSAPAVELVQDEQTKEIRGVVASMDGVEKLVKARKGVILTTGSYTGNAEMMKQYNHAGIYIASYDSPHNTGDAITMTSRVGGQIWGFANESIEYQDWAIKVASEELGMGIRYLKPSGENTAHIFVNKRGERFMNEMLNTRHTHEHLAVLDWDENENEYSNSPFWMVFDQSIMQSSRIGAYGTEEEIDPAYGAAMLMTWNGVYKTYGWSSDNSVELEKGWIVQADTIEELAAKMQATTYFGDTVSVDAARLAATVAEYNAACDAGEDALGRPAASLQSLSAPPYYAVELCPGAMYANAGPRVNAQNNVIDQMGEEIPRLYAAGQGCMTFFGKSGNPNALTAGIQCGRSAAAEGPWE